MSAWETAPEELEVDLSYLPGAEQKGSRPIVRSLGRVAREFREEGGPPPLPKPTIGLVEGVDLPLFYPGLNGLGGPAGTGKSVLVKYLIRQQVWDGHHALVLDCETSEEEYGATLVGDFTMGSTELDLVHYLTDDQRTKPRRDRWSGKVDRLPDALDLLSLDCGCSPSLVGIDSQSKSMALMGMNEGDPTAVAEWFRIVAVPIVDRWPEAAVVSTQGRQKGWAKGMDVRQGRGSSSLLHEVTAQYMMWTKLPGSRTVEGWAELKCTKCRYGYRPEGSLAAKWTYGPSGFGLVAPTEEVENLPNMAEMKQAVLDWLATGPRDQDRPELPPKHAYVVEQVAAKLGLSDSAKGQARVTQALNALIKGEWVQSQKLAQPGVPGVRPNRVWSGEADPGWRWE